VNITSKVGWSEKHGILSIIACSANCRESDIVSKYLLLIPSCGTYEQLRMDKGSVRIHADSLERAAWTLVFFSILNFLSLSSCDTALGFWGVFCAYSKHGRATFGCINCVIFSLLFDIVRLILLDTIKNSHFGSYRKSSKFLRKRLKLMPVKCRRKSGSCERLL
jgi:hypothetical protein